MAMDNAAFEALVRVAPPPTCPVEAGMPDRWDGVERALGTVLPTDYKRFVNIYGSGDFNDLIAVLSPFAAPPDDLLSLVDTLLEPYREGRHRLMPEQCPFPAYPEPEGLLPVAIDTHGGTLYWLTRGCPDDWSLVHYDMHSNYDYQQHSMSLVPFLARWLTGQLTHELLRDRQVLRRTASPDLSGQHPRSGSVPPGRRQPSKPLAVMHG